MSIWLQIGAGILPALIILLLYLMIIRKNVVSSLILLFMFTAGLRISQQAATFRRFENSLLESRSRGEHRCGEIGPDPGGRSARG